MKRTTELGIQRSISNSDLAIDCLDDVQQVTLSWVPHVENKEVRPGDLQYLVDCNIMSYWSSVQGFSNLFSSS